MIITVQENILSENLWQNIVTRYMWVKKEGLNSKDSVSMFLLTVNPILMFISFLNKANTGRRIAKSRNSSHQLFL